MINETVLELIRDASEKNLVELDLSRQQLTQFPPEILKIKSLKKLCLSQNQLRQLPSEIVELQNLVELDLSWNQLTLLPIEMFKLQNLKGLYLSGNKLTHLPSEIAELKSLTTLYLSLNKLTKLPPEIGTLIHLTRAQLSGNSLTDLPPEISKLENLEILNLSENRLTSLPSEISNLQNLEILSLSGNRLTSLPPEISKLENLEILKLSENPLKSPPMEIVSLGLEAIIAFLKNDITSIHNEAKLILLGEGEVGKTCLANRLIHNKFIKGKITEGINVFQWYISAPKDKNNLIKLNVWDFGGQEIYHATHRFFITKNSVYLLVWNARRSKDYEHIYYWLHTIEAFGKGSPIILVMSKKNLNDDTLNLSDLKNQFSTIKGDLIKVDSEDGNGIRELKKNIAKVAWELPSMRTPWLESWRNVKTKTEQLNKNFITHEDFCNICVSEGMNDENINLLDDYLHNIGLILHFKDTKLRGMVILKPQWITEAFYKILSAKSVIERDGILLHKELDQIWTDLKAYPVHSHPQLLELMNKFELAYELPNKNSHLVAERLPQNKPSFLWPEEDNLLFYYCYKNYLPPGIITRFIVRVHQKISKKKDGMPLCWREGVRLTIRNAEALVELKKNEKEIVIKIKGTNSREALADICQELDDINNSIEKIEVEKNIPCTCSDKCIHRYPYNKLLEGEKHGVKNIQCYESFKQVSIMSLLSGYKTKEEREKSQIYYNDPEIKNIFVSQRNKDVIRIATVQLKYTISSSFPFQIENKNDVIQKIYSLLNIATEKSCDIICFPELSLCEEWLPKIKEEFSNMIIIAGSYYNNECNNVCQILVNPYKEIPSQLKTTPATIEEGDKAIKKMVPGKCLNIYETHFGKFAILICRDFCTHEPLLRNKVDILFVPSYNKDTERFYSIADNHVSSAHSYTIISNCAEYGGTAIFGIIHKDRQDILIKKGLKGKGDFNTKLCEIPIGDEGLIIADFNIVYKAVQTPTVSDPKYEIKPVDEIEIVYI